LLPGHTPVFEEWQLDSTANFRTAAAAAAFSVVVGLFPACGGSDGAGPSPGPQAGADQPLEGTRVAGRDEALRIVARGVVAPLYFSELAHAVLAHAVASRASVHGDALPLSSGERWLLTLDAQPLGAGATLDGPVAIDIEAADNVEGLMLRGEPGFVRAVLRFERVALGAAAHVDGAMVLEVSRTSAAAGAARRSQADVLSIADASRTLRWSYLDVAVDAHALVQRLTVVSDVPVNEAGPVWLDATSSAPGRLGPMPAGTALFSGRYVASGVIGFLKARLTLHVGADGGWTIDVDNDKDDRVDFVVHASAHEVRALMPGL
jgi:hypothetical protein